VMSRYAKQHDSDQAHIRSLWVVIVLLAAVCVGLWWGWAQSPKYIRLHYTPQLGQGAIVRINEVPKVIVYGFALYIFQQLNRWGQDGAENYGENVYRLQHFFSDAYRAELLADLKVRSRAGELTGRTRSLAEVPGRHFDDRRVQALGEGTWVVWLDVRIQEHMDALEVKNTDIRYPVRVRHHDVDPEMNPWGLVLDGFAAEPKRLTDEDEAVPPAQTSHRQERTQ